MANSSPSWARYSCSASYVTTGSWLSGLVYATTGSYAISGAWNPKAPASGNYSSLFGGAGGTVGVGTVAGSTEQPEEQKPAVNISKRIKIPWKMYKFVDIKGDRKKSLANATVIGGSIQQWWNSNQNWNSNGFEVKGLKDVHITYMNLIIDSVPIEIEGKPVEKIGILPIATFNAQDTFKVEDNDFVFGGTMKVSKSDPDEIVSVVIDGIDVIAGKYQLA